jgi:hypothetical protein
MGRAPLIVAIFAVSLDGAVAQSGDAVGQPQTPASQCQRLLAIRDQVQKHGQAIEAANNKKADVRTACGLFRRYVVTEAYMLRMLEADGAACGASTEVIQRVRDSHAKAREIGQQVCQAARLPLDQPVMDDRRMPPKPKPAREPWPTQRGELRGIVSFTTGLL